MRKNVSYYLHQGSYVLLDLCHMYCLSRKTIDWIFMKILQETPLWTRKIKIKFRKSCAVHLEFWFGFTDFKRILPHCKMGTFLPHNLAIIFLEELIGSSWKLYQRCVFMCLH